MEISEQIKTLLQNLKVLRFDFKSNSIPSNSDEFWIFLKFPQKISVVRIVGFLFEKLDKERFDNFILPHLTSYTRVADIHLKNNIQSWIREFIPSSQLALSFSRFWHTPSRESIAKFLLPFSTYVIKIHYNIVNINFQDVQATIIHIESIIKSLLQKFSDITLRNQCNKHDSQFMVEEKEKLLLELSNIPTIYSEILDYIASSNMLIEKEYSEISIEKLVSDHDVNYIQLFSSAQLIKLDKLRVLRKSLKECFNEWENIRSLFMDFVDASTYPHLYISAKDLQTKVIPERLNTQIKEIGPLRDEESLNLTSLIRFAGVIFSDMERALGGHSEESPPDASPALLNPSPQVRWCKRALLHAVRQLSLLTDRAAGVGPNNSSIMTGDDSSRAWQSSMLQENNDLTVSPPLDVSLDQLISQLKDLIAEERFPGPYQPGDSGAHATSLSPGASLTNLWSSHSAQDIVQQIGSANRYENKENDLSEMGHWMTLFPTQSTSFSMEERKKLDSSWNIPLNSGGLLIPPCTPSSFNPSTDSLTVHETCSTSPGLSFILSNNVMSNRGNYPVKLTDCYPINSEKKESLQQRISPLSFGDSNLDEELSFVNELLPSSPFTRSE